MQVLLEPVDEVRFPPHSRNVPSDALPEEVAEAGPSRAMDRVQAWHDGLGLAWGSHLLGAVLGEVLHRTVYSDIPTTTTAYALQGHVLRYAEAWKACANTRVHLHECILNLVCAAPQVLEGLPAPTPICTSCHSSWNVV